MGTTIMYEGENVNIRRDIENVSGRAYAMFRYLDQELDGIQGIGISFMLVDPAQCGDDRHVKVRIFSTGCCKVAVEGFLGQEFAGVKILGRFKQLPCSFQVTPGEHLDSHCGVGMEITDIETYEGGIDADCLTLGDDRIDCLRP